MNSKPAILRMAQLNLRWAAAFLVYFAFVACARAQELPASLQSAWRTTGLPLSALSLEVRELSGQGVLSINPEVPRNPASVMKLVTTWAGLLALGPNYVWRTTLYAAPGASIDEQGSLRGPLYIKASGDPLLSIKDVWAMLRDLRMQGIKNLSEVVVDRSIFGAVGINPGAFDGAGDRPYNASPDAMLVGLGAVRLSFYPDPVGKKWIPVVDPAVRGLRIAGELGWRSGTCPGAPQVQAESSVNGSEIVFTVSGDAVGSCGAFSLYRLAFGPETYFEQVFRSLWRELGGTLAHGFRNGAVPANAQALVWNDSLSLADMIRPINKLSNNVMARTLLLSVGAKIHGPGATPSTSAAAVLRLLEQDGVDTRAWFIDNGAGLSRSARLTARGLESMLRQAWASPLMPEYISSLAISGVDGTVRRRLRASDARGMAHLKTGTLRDARALAGYVLGANGKRYSLVSMVNHDNAVAARPFEDALIDWLATR